MLEAMSQRDQCKTELEVLVESLCEHDRRVAQVEAKQLEANQQVAEVTRQLAEHSSATLATTSDFGPGAAWWTHCFVSC